MAIPFERYATQLWDWLDDIDTVDDIAKADDKAYRKMVRILVEKRHQVARSDGYSLTWMEGNYGQSE